MTPTARTVLPTDLVALVSYDGHVYANQAMTLERIGTPDSPHPLETAFEQWFSFATGRHTWISVKGPTLRGLISARKRGSNLRKDDVAAVSGVHRAPRAGLIARSRESSAGPEPAAHARPPSHDAAPAGT